MIGSFFGATDPDAIHRSTAAEIATVAAKASPVSADLLLIEDSAASNAKKRITIGTLPGGGGASPKILIPFGGKLNDAGKFAICNGMSTTADNASAPRTRAPIPVDGTLIAIAYQTQAADATSTLKIHVNGVVEATETLSSVNANFGGVETISVSVSAGDYAEIELDAGTDPNESIVYLVLEAS